MSDDAKCICGCPRSRHVEAPGAPCRGCDSCYEFRPAEEAKPCDHDWQPDPHGGGRFCPLCQAKSAMPTISLSIRHDLSPAEEARAEAAEFAGFYREFPRGEFPKREAKPAPESVYQRARKVLDDAYEREADDQAVSGTGLSIVLAALDAGEQASKDLENYRLRLAGVLTVLEGANNPRPDEAGLVECVACCPTFKAAWRLRDKLETAEIERDHLRVECLATANLADIAERERDRLVELYRMSQERETNMEHEAIEAKIRTEAAERERDEARDAKRIAEANELTALNDLDNARARVAELEGLPCACRRTEPGHVLPEVPAPSPPVDSEPNEGDLFPPKGET